VVKEFSPFSQPEAVVVGLARGLENGTGKRMSQVYAESTVHKPEHYVALSGPCVAAELALGKPTASVLAGQHPSCLQKAAQALSTPSFRLEITEDLAGVEWCGILKNIYAVGMGFLDGLNPGSVNSKAAFLKMSFDEMKRVALKLGSREATLEGLAGLGDLITTSFTPDSHNRRLGEMLALGKKFEDVLDRIGGGIPEGVKSAAILRDMAAKQEFSAPIAFAVDACIKYPAGIQHFLEDIWKSSNSH